MVFWVLKHPRNKIYKKYRENPCRKTQSSASVVEFCFTKIEQVFAASKYIFWTLNTPKMHFARRLRPRPRQGSILQYFPSLDLRGPLHGELNGNGKENGRKECRKDGWKERKEVPTRPQSEIKSRLYGVGPGKFAPENVSKIIIGGDISCRLSLKRPSSLITIIIVIIIVVIGHVIRSVGTSVNSQV